MKALPTFKQLQYLVALDDHKSFSKAADYCFVTQSTLSAGIAALEDMFGSDVVDRSSKQVVLTVLGYDIVANARHMISDAEDMVIRAKQDQEPLSGTLRLGIIPTIAPYLLPRILTPLQKQYPDLDIRLHEDLTDRLVEALKNRHIDVALLAFPYNTPGLTQDILFDEEFVLAAPKDSWKGKQPLSLGDLKGENILLLEDGHCLREHALEACKLEHTVKRSTFSASSLPTLIQMVIHGYGMTLLPAMAAQNDILPSELDIIHFKKPSPVRQIGLAWRANHPQEKDFLLLGDLIKSKSKD